jgi:hypothetical protein
MPKSTTFLFKTGKTPGYPSSMTDVLVLGSAPNLLGLAENIFESVQQIT